MEGKTQLKENRVRIAFDCPICDKQNLVGNWDTLAIASIPHSTTDCQHCNGTLIIEKSSEGFTVVRDFHASLHQEDPRWPATGEGTGVIELVGGSNGAG